MAPPHTDRPQPRSGGCKHSAPGWSSDACQMLSGGWRHVVQICAPQVWPIAGLMESGCQVQEKRHESVRFQPVCLSGLNQSHKGGTQCQRDSVAACQGKHFMNLVSLAAVNASCAVVPCTPRGQTLSFMLVSYSTQSWVEVVRVTSPVADP
ncbi:unnamed protein product [Pleuronectes platessa]|uniref:Uncharacterized protein n=1 Tax=Pleuronectes platessa TaxID=8262 RepID=A0A9N7TPT5_PLEPL|nr:unnamed protein product [Pleuronectes platessa]